MHRALNWGVKMKKPDVLVLLAMVVALGATITGMTAEEKRSASVIASESSIR